MHIENIKIGISNILDQDFHIPIYREAIEQGFNAPCFFVQVLSDSLDRELGRRYKKKILLDIHYFSDKENLNEDCHNIADRLYEVLDYIKADDFLFRTINKRHEVVDGVLHFFLEVSYHLLKEEIKKPYMYVLKEEAGLKDDED